MLGFHPHFYNKVVINAVRNAYIMSVTDYNFMAHMDLKELNNGLLQVEPEDVQQL